MIIFAAQLLDITGLNNRDFQCYCSYAHGRKL